MAYANYDIVANQWGADLFLLPFLRKQFIDLQCQMVYTY